VTDAQRPDAALARFASGDLEQMRADFSLPAKGADPAAIPPSTHAFFFLWIKLPAAGPIPLTLEHAFSFQVSGIEGIRSLRCCVVSVKNAALTISPPLRGEQWVAWNGPSNNSIHRRALQPIDGHIYLGERFAIDWVKLDAAGHPASGDGSEKKEFFGYSQPLLAVADRTVAVIISQTSQEISFRWILAAAASLDMRTCNRAAFA
jgi:hypothetical protein